MSKQAMARLAEFANAGGKVLWVDNPSDSPRPDGAVPIGFGELGDHIKPLVAVQPACAALRVCKRRLANGSIYFVTNEGTQELSCTVSFSESMPGDWQVPPGHGRQEEREGMVRPHQPRVRRLAHVLLHEREADTGAAAAGADEHYHHHQRRLVLPQGAGPQDRRA